MANYPAPILSPDRPIGATAPGSPFVLPDNVTGGATGGATVAEYMRQVGDGQAFCLTGLGLTDAKFPVYSNGRFLSTNVATGDSLKAAVQLPRKGLPWDFGLAWVMAADGISAPVPLNRTTLTWAEKVVPKGGTMQVMGRNLAHGNVKGGASYVMAQASGSNEFVLLTGTAANSYRAEIALSDLPAGTYTGWPHNGHGQQYGWGKPFAFQVVERQQHVLTRDFGPATAIMLSDTDGDANTFAINQAFIGRTHFTTPAGSYPITGNINPRGGVRWACATVESGGRTTLVATNWQKSDLGMIGTNGVTMLVLDGIMVDNPNQDIGADALIVLRSPMQVWLRRSGGRWQRPYDVTDYGSYSIPKEAQVLRFENPQQVYGDDLDITGTGTHIGSRRGGTSGQVALRRYKHRLTNGADHAIYKLNTNGLLILGADIQDLDPDSGDGLTRGSGRLIKCGGQGGTNQNGHFEGVNGRFLGPLFTGANKYYDRNQGEIFLWEGNRTTWQDYVVSATATTLTFSQPVLSRLADVRNEVLQADDPAAGVLPGLHLLRIAKGRGLWQMRGIVSVSGNTITLDEPLNVVPDTGSHIHVGCFTRGNTVVEANVSGKRFIVDDSEFGILTLINYYGGMHDTIMADCKAKDVRHGFIFTPTTHEDGFIEPVTFCEMLNPVIDGCRWGERYESYGREEHPEWHFSDSGLGAIRVSNPRITNVLEAAVVFKVPRTASDVSTYWAAPPIDGLLREGAAVATYLNDYKTPSSPTNFPPIPVAAGTLANFVQLPTQQPMPDLSLTKKNTYFRVLVETTLVGASFLGGILKIKGVTAPNSAGANTETAYTGGSGGLKPGGTLTKLLVGSVYQAVAGVVNGSVVIPNAVEVTVPTITSLNPLSVAPGDTLNITGTNLLATRYVLVGGASALIASVGTTNTNVAVTVPLTATVGSNIAVVVMTETGHVAVSTLLVTSGGSTTQLAAPTNLRQTGSTSTSITMAWDAVPNATGYRLRRNGSVLLLPGTALSYTDTGLTAGATPSYDVQAIGAAPYGDSLYSTSVSAATSGAAIPNAPAVSYDSSSRILTAISSLGAIEYSRNFGGFQPYTAGGLQIDAFSHAAGEWRFRVKANGSTPAGAIAFSPAIGAMVGVVTYSLMQQGLVSDADLSLHPAFQGSNQTAKLKAVTDKFNGSNPGVIIVDVKAMVDLREDPANVRWVYKQDCGFVLTPGVNETLGYNRNRRFSNSEGPQGQVLTFPDCFNIVDENIEHVPELAGGTFIWNGWGYDANGTAMRDGSSLTHGWNKVYDFSGVRNLKIDGLVLRNSRTISGFIRNYDRATLTNFSIEQSDVYPSTAFQDIARHDGPKFLGPGRDMTVTNGTIIRAVDDWVSACDTDTWRRDIPKPTTTQGYTNYDDNASRGPIDNIVIDNITLMDCFHGFRLMSVTESVTNVVISNIQGTCDEFFGLLDNNVPANLNVRPGASTRGNYLNITVRDVNVQVTQGPPTADVPSSLVFVGAPVQNLTLERINLSGASVDYPAYYYGSNASVANLTANDLSVAGFTDLVKTTVVEGTVGNVSGNAYPNGVSVVFPTDTYGGPARFAVSSQPRTALPFGSTWDASVPNRRLSLTGNMALTYSNTAQGQSLTLVVTNTTSAAWTLGIPTAANQRVWASNGNVSKDQVLQPDEQILLQICFGSANVEYYITRSGPIVTPADPYGGPPRQATSNAAFVPLTSTTLDMSQPNRTLALTNATPDPFGLLFSGTAVGQTAQLQVTNTDSVAHTLQIDTNSVHVVYSSTGSSNKTISLAPGAKLGIQVDFTAQAANYYVNYAPTDF